MKLMKTVASQLPERWQTELKRLHFKRQIKKGTFITEEPEYNILDSFIKKGDWVIDIGANIGHYTKKFSELVGENGRVISFEPVPVTFSLLASNVQFFNHQNVTLINTAISDKTEIVGFSIPKFSTKLKNYYEAHIESLSTSSLSVLSISIDSLHMNQKITLVKIDTEGHELFVIEGMKNLIKESRPILIIETGSAEVINNLKSMGYMAEKLHNSPNILFKPTA